MWACVCASLHIYTHLFLYHTHIHTMLFLSLFFFFFWLCGPNILSYIAEDVNWRIKNNFLFLIAFVSSEFSFFFFFCHFGLCLFQVGVCLKCQTIIDCHFVFESEAQGILVLYNAEIVYSVQPFPENNYKCWRKV